MFNIKFGYKFEAAHRLTHTCAARCMTPHGHTWRAEVELLSKTDVLDEADMVVSFAAAKRLFKVFVDETLDHSMMINADDPVRAALEEMIADVRLLPFPGDPTTERIAQLIFRKVETFIKADGLDDIVMVHEVNIIETPTNSVSYRPTWRPPNEVKGFEGWWCSPDPLDRSIQKVSK